MDLTDRASRKVVQLVQVHPPVPRGHSACTILSGARVLGRSVDDGADLVLEDPLVSRAHARLDPRAEGGFVVTDLGSKNGVFVDGRKVPASVLPDGSVLRLGGTLLVVREVGVDAPPPMPPGLPFAGSSPALRQVEEACRRIAPTPATVLLRGETGTGKEVFARYLHRCSGRRGRFVAVNCAAVSAGLFESAFFGHRKGAFTGATKDFGGHAKAAAGGTLFLDEVAELPDESQAKLLRFLESGELATVGEPDAAIVDVRVVAATNQDLESRLQSGRLRGDLYARLAQRVVVLPPLRKRPEDALEIARSRLPAGHPGLSADAAEALAVHDWPFNVRELLAVMDAAVTDAPAGVPLPLGVLPDAIRGRVTRRPVESPPSRMIPAGRQAPAPDDSSDTIAQPVACAPDPAPSRDAFTAVFRDCGGNVSEVARRLGKDRRQVYRWMDRYGLK